MWFVQTHLSLSSPCLLIRMFFPSWYQKDTFLVGGLCPASGRMDRTECFRQLLFLRCLQLKITQCQGGVFEGGTSCSPSS